jgi:hypothetical protein
MLNDIMANQYQQLSTATNSDQQLQRISVIPTEQSNEGSHCLALRSLAWIRDNRWGCYTRP